MNRFGKLICISMCLVGLLSTAQAADQLKKSESPSSGTFRVKVARGYLSLDAKHTPLVQIFREIGKQAKITFESNIGPEEKVTIHLDRVPLEDGIKQLAKNVTVFYTENPKDKS